MKKLNRTAISSLTILASTLAYSPVNAANFSDVALSAGFDTHSRSSGWADYNEDGCVDVVRTGSSGATLHKNNCDGSFTDATVESGISVTDNAWAAVWADYDGDNLIDVFITAGSSSVQNNTLWRNLGDGTFENVTTSTGLDGVNASAGASWADFDQDGDLDLFVASRFDPDTTPDYLFRNDDGVFTDIAASAGVQGAIDRLTFMGVWFDYDIDGDQDLYVAIDFGTDVLYRNNLDGTFTDVSLEAGIGAPTHGMGIYTGDLNNDGCEDIVSSNNSRTELDNEELSEFGPSMIYLNNCDGTFTPGSYASGIADRGVVNWGVSFIDYDNDGDLDFSEVSGAMLTNGEPNAFYENDGSGQLFDITQKAGVEDEGDAFGSAWVDYDNDGDLDWFVSNTANVIITDAFFQNNSVTGHYLRVKLNGADKNTDAVGAVVKITSGSRTQMRTIQAGRSYANSEELVAHFGLGVKDKIDSVSVQWPTGGTTELSDITADQTLVIDEVSEPITTSISGTVTDPSGLPVFAAIIDIRDAATNQIVNISRTDVNGQYLVDTLPPGEYKIAAIKTGFAFSLIQTITLQAGDNLLIDLQLRALAP